ncbi:MAG: hypothetical protein ACOX5Z_09425 [Desulfobulbus sp.]
MAKIAAAGHRAQKNNDQSHRNFPVQAFVFIKTVQRVKKIGDMGKKDVQHAVPLAAGQWPLYTVPRSH